MTPEERAEAAARIHRLRAKWFKFLAAREELNATAAETGEAMRKFAAALTDAEKRDVAEHPDLAELNLQLDGYYGETRDGC
ncbi:hypothetical protein [Kitasatospora cineracea]|uniref:Uncharacterized protein n=1 Tax=Kitasatospora cineracea TaxID=88074 RepID=A0A3N4SEQ0_9ACTN|nr:hypothetical protein [Kitasatospora cineracea]RPE34934.1 hypothetical protein EDD38_3276 [Kitasatospora cineracea]